MKRGDILYLVVPCYNEEEMLDITTDVLNKKMQSLIKEKKISKKSKVLYVNDGSKDHTWNMITKVHKENDLFCGIKLSRNKGSQNAIYAGLMVAKEYADVTITVEADLQDDVDVIDKMLEEYDKGAEIVYGVRSSRKTDTFFKKMTAGAFYRFMNFIGVEMVLNHSECRLMSKVAIEGLEQFKETNLFLRGMVPQIGYQTAIAYYDRGERVVGKTKFNLKKMLNFAMDGIVSFSVAPLRLITSVGCLISSVSFLILIILLIMKLIGNTVSNFAFLMDSLWLIGGMELLAIGIIGEYIGKMQLEVKKRPRYIIEEELL